MVQLIRRLPRDDRGSMAVSVAVIPQVMLAFLLVMQVGMWFHGRSVITAAAQHGLEAATVGGGNAAAGTDTARQFIAQVGGVKDDPAITTQQVGNRMVITIEADVVGAVPLIPGISEMTVTLSAPVEQVVN